MIIRRHYQLIRVAIAVLIVLVVIMLGLALMRSWLDSRPPWVLTAKNSPTGLVVEVHQSDAAEPTYVVVLPGKSVPRDFSRVARADADPNVVTTTFFDDTLKPGRWTLTLDGTKLDIMEARMWIDDQQTVLTRPESSLAN
jgi:hypothetical protein